MFVLYRVLINSPNDCQKTATEEGNWGEFDPRTQTAYVNFTLCTKAGDATLTALHEISHAVLCAEVPTLDTPDHHPTIYGVQYSSMSALKFVGFEFSREFKDHLFMLKNECDPNWIHQVPIIDILEKWLPYVDPIII
jgi:hypothetical protein